MEIAEMILNLRVLRQLRCGGGEVLLRVVQVTPAEMRPTQAVEVRAVVGLDIERPADESNGFVELLAADGQQISEIVQRVGIARFGGKQLAKHALGIVASSRVRVD